MNLSLETGPNGINLIKAWEGIEDGEAPEVRHPSVPVLETLLQPRKGLIVIPEPHTDERHKGTTDVRLASPPLKFSED